MAKKKTNKKQPTSGSTKKQSIKKTKVGASYQNNYDGHLAVVFALTDADQDALLSEIQSFVQSWKSSCSFYFAPTSSYQGNLEELGKGIAALGNEQLNVVVAPSTFNNRSAALKWGVANAQGDHILVADEHLGISLLNLCDWVDQAEGHSLPSTAIWTASRRHPDSKPTTKVKANLVPAAFYNAGVQLFTSLNLRDTQSHFMLWPVDLAQALYASSPVANDLDMLYQADLHDLEVQEQPVTWQHPTNYKANAPEFFKKLLGLFKTRWLNRFAFFFLQPFKEAKLESLAQKESPFFRMAFALGSILLFILMCVLSFDYGITGDEVLQKEYGDNVLAYFETNGKDRGFMQQNNVHYYGGLFDYTASWCNKHIGGGDEYDMRHLLNAIFGFLAILFAGRIGRLVSGSWRVALLTLLFLALSPRFFGHCMNNPKDIPFATGYLIGIYYMLHIAKQLPRVSWKAILMTIVGMCITINMRSGGILLIPYLGVFMAGAVLFRPELRPVLFKVKLMPLLRMLALFVGIVLMGYWSGTWFWPYAQEDILNHPFESLREMTNFATGIRMLWNGEHLWSDQLPWYYIPQWLIISSPIVVLLGLPLLGGFFLHKTYKKRWLTLGLALFTAVFPLAYAIYKGSSLYDGMRHFLFIYPLLVFAAAFGWVILADLLKHKVAKIIIAVAIAGMLILPMRWMVVSHPYQYTYFNEFFGGIKAAYGYYETDYWMTCMRRLSDWVIENEPKVKAGEKVVVATNCHKPVAHYFKDYPNVKVEYVRYHQRVRTSYDYLLSYSRFISHGFIQSGAWPPGNVVYLESVDGVPLGAVTKNESGNKDGAAAQAAFKKGDFAKAVEHLDEVLAKDPKNESAMLLSAQACVQIRQFDKMKEILDQMHNLADDYVNGLGVRGLYYVNTGKVDSAKIVFNRAVELNYKYTFGYYYLASIAAQNDKNLPLAIDYLLKFDEYGGQPAQGYNFALQCAKQQGSRLHELYFQAKLLASQGKHSEAFQLGNQCLGIDPDFEPAKKMVDQYKAANERADKEKKMQEKMNRR